MPGSLQARFSAMLTHSDCRAIASLYGSPFYVLDPDVFRDNYRRFQQAFVERYSTVRIGYSYKTNYIPYLCRLVKDLGGYAEVVSRLEYDLALSVGQDPQKIIFNGPVKQDEDIDLALQRGSTLNLDAWYEVDRVECFHRRHPETPLRLGVRINCRLMDESGRSQIQEGLADSRFGFPPEALGPLAERLRAAGLSIQVLHGHTSSSSRSAWLYDRITRTLCELAERHLPQTVDEINVGGGFFGDFPAGFGPPERPSFDEYASVIAAALRDSAWARERRPVLTLEPGVALVGNALSFVTRVMEIKQLGDLRTAVVDGSIFHTKPSLHKKPQPFQIVCGENRASGGAEMRVTGSTCMEKDILLEGVAARLEPGDFVCIDNVGAYTVVMSPTFIHPAPAIVARGPDGVFPVRHRQTFAQAFAGFVF